VKQLYVFELLTVKLSSEAFELLTVKLSSEVRSTSTATTRWTRSMC